MAKAFIMRKLKEINGDTPAELRVGNGQLLLLHLAQQANRSDRSGESDRSVESDQDDDHVEGFEQKSAGMDHHERDLFKVGRLFTFCM